MDLRETLSERPIVGDLREALTERHRVALLKAFRGKHYWRDMLLETERHITGETHCSMLERRKSAVEKDVMPKRCIVRRKMRC